MPRILKPLISTPKWMETNNMNDYLQIIIVGLCTGIGSAIGNYMVQKSLIHNLEKINKK